MRHRKKTVKLGRTSSHRAAMLSSLVGHLIDRRRIKTTLPKARAARSLAERMVTLGKDGTMAARRRAYSKLQQNDQVTKLFDEVAPSFKERAGGYTRIIKLGRRSSDSSEMVFLEWVEPGTPAQKKKSPKKKVSEKAAPKKEVVEKVALAEAGKDDAAGTSPTEDSQEKGESEASEEKSEGGSK